MDGTPINGFSAHEGTNGSTGRSPSLMNIRGQKTKRPHAISLWYAFGLPTSYR